MFALKLFGVFPTSDIQYFDLVAYVAEYDSNSFGSNT